MLRAISSLLQQWAAGCSCRSAAGTQPSSHKQQQPRACALCDCGSPALLTRDLPCAVLQQKQLLVNCRPQELVRVCLRGMGVSKAADVESTCQDPPTSSCASGGDSREQQARSAAGQLLDCSNNLCAAALEVVNLSMRHRLQQQHDGVAVSWLAREWLQADGGAATSDLAVPDLAAAKQLLAAATGVDQQLKAAVAFL